VAETHLPELIAAAADMCGCGHSGLPKKKNPSKVIMRSGRTFDGDAPDGIRTRATALKGL
jgi:hypothetical protein